MKWTIALGVATALLCAPTATAQVGQTARVEQAERLARAGDRDAARSAAAAIVRAYEAGPESRVASEHVAAGRAYLLLSQGDAEAVRQALAAFDRAAELDPADLDARLRAAELLLTKYNAPDAKAGFEEVLAIDSANARALTGLARVAAFTNEGSPLPLLERAVAADPRHGDAHVELARMHLAAEAFDSAMVRGRQALAADSLSLDAWAVVGASAWLAGDSASYRAARAAAERITPRPADFWAELAEAAVRARRYREGVAMARQALALDSTSTRALGLLGTTDLRAGNIAAGRASLERAFALDPFNLWHKNTLDLLDRMATFRTVERGRFHVVAPPEEAELLTTYLLPLLEQAYDSLARRYDYRPPAPIRFELYRQHADFSVRTVGLTGLGALGASFGPVLVMDAPSARARGEFNWGSTAWHELAHTFTLGLSENRAPRWLSEGLSVLEERRARPWWGAGVTPEFLAAYAAGRIRPPSQLNDGFVRPRSPAEVGLSYYAASLVCEMIAQQFGERALRDLLVAYRDGLATPAVFARVLKVSPEALDRRFDAWLRARFAGPMQAMTAAPSGGSPFVEAMRTATAQLAAGATDSARVTFERAQRLFPDYVGDDAPALHLARLARARGDLREALAQVARVTARNESAWEANVLEAELREQTGDSTGAMVPLERLIWISPYDLPTHVRLARLAERAGDLATALRERRAVVALAPPDPLEARYELARVLLATGDRAAARREVLGVLEQVPSYEPALELLLQIRATAPSTSGVRP